MKKVLKALAVFAILITLTCACGKEKNPFIGTWNSIYLHENEQISLYIKIKEDNTFERTFFKENEFDKKDKGTYTIEGNELKLKRDNLPGIIEYEYDGEYLINGSHMFRKTNDEIPEK